MAEHNSRRVLHTARPHRQPGPRPAAAHLMLSGVGTKLQYGSRSVRSPIHTPPRFSSDTSAVAGCIHFCVRQVIRFDVRGHTRAGQPKRRCSVEQDAQAHF